jgi:hypothetical protein
LRESYRRLLVNTWIGAIGTKGRKALASSTLNMLKLELAAIPDVLEDASDDLPALGHAPLFAKQEHR